MAVKAKHRITGSAVDRENREKDDFYATPLEGIMPLLKVESFVGDIWEPACGDGRVSEAMKAWGYDVVSTDLVDRNYSDGTHGIDFLMETKPRARNIVTNPPFCLMNEFIEKGIELNMGKLCLLGRIQVLESAHRATIFKKHPPSRIHVFSRRLSLYRPNYVGKGKGMLALAWFVWDRGFHGQTTITWI